MANAMTQNPWYIDTAGATSIYTKRVKVIRFRWVGATTAGHHCTVLRADGTGTPLWDSVASGANFIEETFLDEDGKFGDGIQVSVLASGILYIYIG